MSKLRTAVMLYAVTAVVGAFLIIRSGQGLAIAAYLGINGLIVGLAVILERGRYSPRVSGSEGWEITDEKFQDATTGKWMVVRYNKRTGERDYIELKEKH